MKKYKVTFIFVSMDMKANTETTRFDDLEEAFLHMKGITRELDQLCRKGKIYNFRSDINTYEDWGVL